MNEKAENKKASLFSTIQLRLDCIVGRNIELSNRIYNKSILISKSHPDPEIGELPKSNDSIIGNLHEALDRIEASQRILSIAAEDLEEAIS